MTEPTNIAISQTLQKQTEKAIMDVDGIIG